MTPPKSSLQAALAGWRSGSRGWAGGRAPSPRRQARAGTVQREQSPGCCRRHPAPSSASSNGDPGALCLAPSCVAFPVSVRFPGARGAGEADTGAGGHGWDVGVSFQLCPRGPGDHGQAVHLPAPCASSCSLRPLPCPATCTGAVSVCFGAHVIVLKSIKS